MSGFDDPLWGTPSTPAPRPSVGLDDPTWGLPTSSAPPPSTAGGGIWDRLKGMSARDWLAAAIRVGGGYIAGIPSSVPGVGSLIGGGIGGGSEALAELVGGQSFDPASIGVASAAGAIPMGKVFGVAGAGLKDAGLLERLAIFGSKAVPNAVKGAALNVGTDLAYRGAHGDFPTSLSEETVPALIGAGGGLAATLATRTALPRREPMAPYEPGPLPPTVPRTEGAPLPPAATRGPVTTFEQIHGFDADRLAKRSAPDVIGDWLTPRGPSEWSGTAEPGNLPLNDAPGVMHPHVEPPESRPTSPQAALGPDVGAGEGATPSVAPGAPQGTPGPTGVASPTDRMRTLYDFLKPQWAESRAKLSDVPFDIPDETFAQFNERVATDPPRQLMGEERKVRAAIDAQHPPMSGSETGAVDPGLAYMLGGGAAGAVAGPVVNSALDDPTDPKFAALGGAGLGILSGMAVKSPGLLNRLRYANLLSGMAVPKKILSDVGGMGAAALEHPDKAGALARELFSPETFTAGRRGFMEGHEFVPGAGTDARPGAEALDIFSRTLQGVTEGARSVYERAGLGDEAALRTASNKPLSDSGKRFLSAARTPIGNFFLPIAKVPINLFERGIESTPGLGSLPAVRAWRNATPEQALKRQMIGGGAMAALGGLGAATAPGGPLEDYKDAADYAPLLVGPTLTVPAEAAMHAGRVFAGGGDSLEGLLSLAHGYQRALPTPVMLPSSAKARTVAAELLAGEVPFGGLTRKLDPGYPDYHKAAKGDIFGPAIAQVPLLNEWAFGHRAAPTPSAPPGRPAVPAWTADPNWGAR